MSFKYNALHVVKVFSIMILGGLNVGYCVTVYGVVESYFAA
jgi:hypothetical protein